MTKSSHGKSTSLTAKYNLIGHINFLSQRLRQSDEIDQLAGLFSSNPTVALNRKELRANIWTRLKEIRHLYLSSFLSDDAVLARELFCLDAILSSVES
jgi:hypothetical protein